MDALSSQYRIANGDCVEEMICLRTFHAAETLKNKIRKTIFNYQQRGWELIRISIQGPCIHLKFEPQNMIQQLGFVDDLLVLAIV